MRFIFWAIFFNLFLLASLLSGPSPRLVFLSVGQGDAALSFSGSFSILVDAGPSGEAARGISRVLGRRKYLDVVFISHLDKDHWGGFPEVAKRYEIGAVVFPGDPSSRPDIKNMPPELANAVIEAERKGSRLVSLGAGSSVDLGADSVFIMSPDNSAILKGDNNRSLVVRLESPGRQTLFTGDIGRTAEKYLIKKYGRKLHAQILKVSHHGAKSSSGADFLSAVSPEAAVISVGKNSYGHPSSETIARIIAAGGEVFRTDRLGDVSFPSEVGNACRNRYWARACSALRRVIR